MLAGVTIERPETVTIDAHVQAGTDTIIEPFARLLGATTIGEDCRIGAGAILENAILADGVDGRTIYTDRRFARRYSGAGRSVRASAHGCARWPRRPRRQFRRAEKNSSGRRREEPASGVPGRFGNRRARQHRRGHHHLQLRRARRSTGPPSARAPSSAATPLWWRRSRSARTATSPRAA